MSEKKKNESIYKVDLDLPLSVNLNKLRDELVTLRGKFQDLERVGNWNERFDYISGSASTMICALHLIIGERRNFEIKCDDQRDGPSLKFSSRGLGSDQVPGCFVCGARYRDAEATEKQYICMSNIAAFVESQASGNMIVTWFGNLARLDYRDYEPNYIQVKVGACNEHFPMLQKLDRLTSVHGVIRKTMIEECKKI